VHPIDPDDSIYVNLALVAQAKLIVPAKNRDKGRNGGCQLFSVCHLFFFPFFSQLLEDANAKSASSGSSVFVIDYPHRRAIRWVLNDADHRGRR
jgi:hypothetical protein